MFSPLMTLKRLVFRRLSFPVLFLALAWCSLSVQAAITVGVGATTTIGAGTSNQNCTDIVVNGTLVLTTGSLINVRNVTINPGGILRGGSGLVSVSGNWTNSGSFVPGTGLVQLLDVPTCPIASSTIIGNNTFFNLTLDSTTGKTYIFQSSSTQTVLGALNATGVGAPLQTSNTIPGQPAFLVLGPGATQNWVNTPVQPGLISPVTQQIPTLGDVALLMLSLLMLLYAWHRRAVMVPRVQVK
jgi:hypothetical protein